MSRTVLECILQQTSWKVIFQAYFFLSREKKRFWPVKCTVIEQWANYEMWIILFERFIFCLFNFSILIYKTKKLFPHSLIVCMEYFFKCSDKKFSQIIKTLYIKEQLYCIFIRDLYAHYVHKEEDSSVLQWVISSWGQLRPVSHFEDIFENWNSDMNTVMSTFWLKH